MQARDASSLRENILEIMKDRMQGLTQKEIENIELQKVLDLLYEMKSFGHNEEEYKIIETMQLQVFKWLLDSPVFERKRQAIVQIIQTFQEISSQSKTGTRYKKMYKWLTEKYLA